MTSFYRCYNCRQKPVKENILGLNFEKLKQTQLCFAETGQLTYTRPTKDIHSTQITWEDPLRGNNCPILKLPDELLDEILAVDTLDPLEWWRKTRYEDLLAIVVVCKRFNRLATPHLYYDVRFENSCGIVPPCIPFRYFHRTMRENPLLRPFCKELHIYISDITRAVRTNTGHDYDLANDLVTLLPNVKYFDLQGGFGRGKAQEAWTFIKRAVEHMPQIEKFELHREDLTGLSATDIIRFLYLPRLRCLKIVGICSNSSPVLKSTLPKHHQGTASFSTLSISDFSDPPSALKALLEWPKTLVHFEFNRIYYHKYNWSLTLFESMLHEHKSSLRTLSIGLMNGRSRCLNLTGFPNLEKLTLSKWEFDFGPEAAATGLLAPKLNTFVWDFGIYDQHTESWASFGKESQDWILKFAQHSVARNSALKKIMIKFQPEWCAPTTWEAYDGCGYPWGRMDEVDNAIRPLGLRLGYFPPPPCTQAEIEEEINRSEGLITVGTQVAEEEEMMLTGLSKYWSSL